MWFGYADDNITLLSLQLIIETVTNIRSSSFRNIMILDELVSTLVPTF